VGEIKAAFWRAPLGCSDAVSAGLSPADNKSGQLSLCVRFFITETVADAFQILSGVKGFNTEQGREAME